MQRFKGLARDLGREFSPVRVNTASPGMINTPLWSNMADDAKAYRACSDVSHVHAIYHRHERSRGWRRCDCLSLVGVI